jgi:anti-sigma B factor antagonist
MAIKEHIHGDVAVLTPAGSMLGDPESAALRDRIKGLIGDGFLKIVLDLSRLEWVNSAGLGALIASLTSLTQAGGELRLACVTDKIKSLFLITQLVKVFKTYETVDRAVASFIIDPVHPPVSE